MDLHSDNESVTDNDSFGEQEKAYCQQAARVGIFKCSYIMVLINYLDGLFLTYTNLRDNVY